MSINRGTTINAGTRLVVAHCYACGVPFGLGDQFKADRREDRKTFYCPNGHGQAYTGGKSEAQKRKEAEARETALKDQLSAAIRDADATRVHLLRDRQRFANGVCPCCNRSFENVRRHMRTQHPDFSVDHTEAPTYRCSCGSSFDSLRGLRTHQGHQRKDGWDAPKAPSWRSHLTRV